MLERIELRSFKGFRDYSCDFDQFTNLVGLNSRGKTTILQAIRFTYDLMEHIDRMRTVGTNRWQYQADDFLGRQTFGDSSAIWFERNTAVPCELKVFFSGGIVVTQKVLESKILEIEIGGVKTGDSASSSAQDKLRELMGLKAVFVPPMGGASGTEDWLSFPSYKNEKAKGRQNETWRNELYWRYNEGGKQKYDDIVSLVSQYIPNTTIHPPRQSRDGTPKILIDFVENSRTYDIGLSGAGLRSLLNLAGVLLLSDSSLMLFDEPDSHLHGLLQRKVAEMLSDFACERGVQIITTTHAPDYLACVPVDSIRWIDRSERHARRVDGVAKVLVDLGSISASEALRFKNSTAILFVEGKRDRTVLLAAAKVCGFPNLLDDGKVILAELPSGKSSSEALSAFPHLFRSVTKEDIKCACIVDNDWELISEQKLKDESSGIVSLRRKEVENYLIEPTVFSLAASKAASQAGKTYPSVEEVEVELSRIAESHRNTVYCHLAPKYRETLEKALAKKTQEQRGLEWFNAKWSEASWRLKALPGKLVLRDLRSWTQKDYQLTVTDKFLAEALQPDADLIEVFKKLDALLSGSTASE